MKLDSLKKSRFLSQLEAEKQRTLDNPTLAPKAAKQKINSLKQAQELALRELAAPAVAEVLAKALQMALGGDRRMIEMILSFHLSKPSIVDETDNSRATVQILVQNLTQKNAPLEVEAKVVDEPSKPADNSSTEL